MLNIHLWTWSNQKHRHLWNACEQDATLKSWDTYIYLINNNKK